MWSVTEYRVQVVAEQPELRGRRPPTLFYDPVAARLGAVPGTGCTGHTLVGIGDFNGDGNPDVIVRDDASRILWLYPRTGAAFSVRQQIGSGWQASP
ncbi:VCBS repeat-containing protein [Streptomyces asoensis]|uniref:FG-GAP repeat domain-containing protein n=1 Tax=Streptomyces asoensis TaxID=249586 RepID=UPI00340E05CE